MNAMHVRAPGLFTTVQDLGRPGFGPMGVSSSGAAEAISLRIGNRLVGNAEGAAALEMTLLGGTFFFPQGAVVALTGSDFGATLSGATRAEVPVPLWSSCAVLAGDTLRLGPTRSGARCYLCVRGGIAVKPFLGSASTHVLSGLGGFQGRPLQKDDVLEVGAAVSSASSLRTRTLAPLALERLVPGHVLRVTAGPQNDWFSESALESFYAGEYRVTEEANRMGLRLQGSWESALEKSASGGQMITEGVSLGAIQVTPEGQPIVLFVEQQTTGGYPKIANVISADLHALGQLRPRDTIRFERVEMETARAALREQEQLLSSAELILE